MLYKILLVLGIVYLARLIFNSFSQQEKINNQKPKKEDPNTVDAEYTVIDDEK